MKTITLGQLERLERNARIIIALSDRDEKRISHLKKALDLAAGLLLDQVGDCHNCEDNYISGECTIDHWVVIFLDQAEAAGE